MPLVSDSTDSTIVLRGAWQRSLFCFYTCVSPGVAALALVFFVGYGHDETLAELGWKELLLGAYAGVAFIVGLMLLNTKLLRTRRPLVSLLQIGGITVVVALPLVVAFHLRGTDVLYWRTVLVYELVLLLVLFVINNLRLHAAIKLLVNISVLFFALFPTISAFIGKQEADGMTDYVSGSYYDLKITDHAVLDEETRAKGGALELVDDRHLLLVTGEGAAFVVTLEGGHVRIEPLQMTAPIDIETYLEHNPNPMPRWFRVYDVLLEKRDVDTRSLYVSYTHWDVTKNCYTVRLSEAKVSLESGTATPWVLRYESQPCLKLGKLNNVTGGRLAFLNSTSILMSIGDHGTMDPESANDEGFSYGKILHLNVNDWSVGVFTKGHRNPQGLWVEESEIWETEHGPDGGDELNLLKYGTDYGWPTETYGTDYGKKTFELSKNTGDHSQKMRPVYSWIPSIGVSNLIRLQGKAYPAWKGDLLVASLSGQGNGLSLYRIRIREGRAVVVERLRIGDRIRDLIELPDGRLVLWNGFSKIQVLEPANHVFSQCIACHALRYRNHGIGPDLMGVVGRKVAYHEEYDYSRAMREYGGEWTPERLDTFLTNPDGTVSGTSMDFEGIKDPKERRAVIDYLQKLQR